MKYYQDITLLPDAEVTLGFLWQKVYQQLHLALVEMKSPDNKSKVAVSWPEYGDNIFPLGNKLRLFAETQEQLNQLSIAKWLNRLTDYTHYTSIREVPHSVKLFACFKRKQFDTNVYRLSRRWAKRKGVSLEQALDHFSDFKEQESDLPFVNMVSLSTNNKSAFSNPASTNEKFRLFIEREIVDKCFVGEFNCYGLSSREPSEQATVPWF